ncbi:hypothetical protein JVT61DRAFT_11439 [Boletus reticuloceps]|uniref:MULE transposase domain-containing protein n=1 Tax=Boletus reticuloceps TaxID=495285 RepID=A0A8I2YWL5_9AGAM|nr:hypothetical protein JVT61DRAFT_11439 [Boletus reticuloceps]
MVIGYKNKGVPVAQILFTARKDAKAVHADYNSKLLEDLLGHWKRGMGKNTCSEEFSVSVAITDNDTRKRFALKATWDGVFLILCRFHTWQAWWNGLNRSLQLVPNHKQHVLHQRLAKLLMKLLKDITTYETAITSYNEELLYFKNVKQTVHEPLIQKKQMLVSSFLPTFKTT